MYFARTGAHYLYRRISRIGFRDTAFINIVITRVIRIYVRLTVSTFARLNRSRKKARTKRYFRRLSTVPFYRCERSDIGYDASFFSFFFSPQCAYRCTGNTYSICRNEHNGATESLGVPGRIETDRSTERYESGIFLPLSRNLAICHGISHGDGSWILKRARCLVRSLGAGEIKPNRITRDSAGALSR